MPSAYNKKWYSIAGKANEAISKYLRNDAVL